MTAWRLESVEMGWEGLGVTMGRYADGVGGNM